MALSSGIFSSFLSVFGVVGVGGTVEVEGGTVEGGGGGLRWRVEVEG